MEPPDRRRFLTSAGLSAAAAALGRQTRSAVAQDTSDPQWLIALNTSTIRPATLEVKVRAAAEAGYRGIELWSNELSDHAKAGNSLEKLGRRLKDLGLTVPNIIGLWNAMPEDDSERPAALDRARRQMEEAAQVGATHIATVPTPDRPSIDLLWAAERYRELLEVGLEYGVIPAVEFVAFMQGVYRLGQAVAIALEANHPEACIVADAFHLYRGGSGFNGMRHLSPHLIACFHINDAPAEPPQFEQKDSDRVLPGDGILPLPELLRDLREIGFRGPLSLELFKRDLWEQDPVAVAKLGLAKVRQVIAESERLG